MTVFPKWLFARAQAESLSQHPFRRRANFLGCPCGRVLVSIAHLSCPRASTAASKCHCAVVSEGMLYPCARAYACAQEKGMACRARVTPPTTCASPYLVKALTLMLPCVFSRFKLKVAEARQSWSLRAILLCQECPLLSSTAGCPRAKLLLVPWGT